MTIERRTGTIVSFESGGKSEIQSVIKRLSNSMDAIFLKMPVLIEGSARIIRELKDYMRKNNFDKPIIIDYRLEQSELDSLKEISILLKNEEAYGMTVMAISGEDFIKSCKKEAEIEIFAIVDVGTQSFRDRFNDGFVIENAIFARDSECEGIVMTARHLDRIRKVKKVIGNDLQLLATIEKESKIGNTISAGADFEIVPCELLE